MSRVSLRMISIGSLLLIFSDQSFSSSSSSSSSSRCISEAQFLQRVEKLRRRYDKLSDFKSPTPGDRTCAQAAKEMHGDLNNRSVSPWRTRINRDDSRFPSEIPTAECLCQGCIINQREDHNYNSVPVEVVIMVLRRSECPNDDKKYLVEKEFVKLPMACVCVVPKFTTGP